MFDGNLAQAQRTYLGILAHSLLEGSFDQAGRVRDGFGPGATRVDSARERMDNMLPEFLGCAGRGFGRTRRFDPKRSHHRRAQGGGRRGRRAWSSRSPSHQGAKLLLHGAAFRPSRRPEHCFSEALEGVAREADALFGNCVALSLPAAGQAGSGGARRNNSRAVYNRSRRSVRLRAVCRHEGHREVAKTTDRVTKLTACRALSAGTAARTRPRLQPTPVPGASLDRPARTGRQRGAGRATACGPGGPTSRWSLREAPRR